MRTFGLVRRAIGGMRPVALAVALIGGPVAAAAQANPCTRFHPMVDGVQVRGARRLGADVAASVITVERSSVLRTWLGLAKGGVTCLDSADVALDAAAIREQYASRGFIAAHVDGQVIRHGDRRARVVYQIDEGVPVTISRVDVTGLPAAAADSALVARRLLGRPMDDSVVNAVADSVYGLVRDAGYARAPAPVVTIRSDSARRQGTARLAFTPGPLTYIGRVNVRITPSGTTPILGEGAVRDAFGVHAGEAFNARRISDGQRALAGLDLYRQVRVDTAAGAGATGTARDTIGLDLGVAEGDRRRANTSLGWGTLDCFRTQARAVEQDVLGLGHRLEFTGRLSKIGVAEPFSGLQSLCASRVRSDPYSQQLNYYAGATLRLRGLPALRGRTFTPELTLFSERRSAIGTYEQTTDLGALVSSTQTLGSRLQATLQYQYTDSRTRADRAVSCTQFGFCRLEDVASFLLRSPQHSILAQVAKNPLLPTDDPQSGYRWQAEAKYGHASIGQLLPIDFGRFMVEAASYTPVLSWLTVAAHAQVGVVVAPADRSFLLPPSERLYGGGQNTVRGYDQNLLGPGSYIVTAIDTVQGPGGTQYGVARPDVPISRVAPSGGNAMWVANLELRTRRGWPTELLKWVAFLDVGRVWNTRDAFSVTNADARATPGIGVRFVTPLGPFRMDIGYNPNSLESGPAFLVVPGNAAAGVAGRAICVSPGSDDPLGGAGTAPSAAFCPATFLPARSHSLLSRLTFHFSLGNAF